MSRTLTIDVPDELYTRLERQAKLHQRSVHDEVVRRLEETEDESDMDRDALWERIDRLREEGPTIDLSPTELKRIMREGLA
jgi:predicted transcriptional regulator